jgi:uncharacterized membrane protein
MTLLVIKSTAIALGAIPVFLLAKKILGKPMWGLVFAAGYLLYPALHGINWYDFQPQVFFPTLALFTILFIELKRNKLAIVFSILAMSTVELAPFFIIALGLSYLIVQRTSIVDLFRQHKFNKLIKSLPIVLILVAIVWLSFIFSTTASLGWQTSFHLSNQRRVSLADSVNVLGALSYDWQSKILYLVLLFGPFAFLVFLAPIRLFPGGLWILYSLLSNYGPYYTISFHYPSFAIPFIIVAAIFGLKKIQKPSNKRRTQITSLILCCAIGLATIVASPVGPFHLGNYPWTGPFGIPNITPHAKYVHDLAELIPANASVLTGNDLFPLVAQRTNAYVFPFSTTFPDNSTDSNNVIDTYTDFNGTLDTYLRKVEYVLYDSTSDIAAAVIFPTRNAAKDFGLYAEADGAILLKRGYVGSAVLFVPYERIFRSNDLVPINSTIVQDSSSESGMVLYHNSPDSTSDFWHGPGHFLAYGTYSVDFRLKLAGNSSSSPILLAVDEWPSIINIEMSGSASLWYIPKLTYLNGNQTYLTSNSLEMTDFTQKGSYQTFSLQFTVQQPGGFGFVGLAVPKATSIYLDYIKLTQVLP